MVEILVNEPTAALRAVVFQLVGIDGITPASAEVGGQPQISINNGAWTNTGIGLLINPGGGTVGSNPTGRYHAFLDVTVIAQAKDRIETRYKSVTTAECPGDSIVIVAFDATDEAQAFGRLAGQTVVHTSIIGPTGEIGPIYVGDDYLAVDNRAIDIPDLTGWPDLTGATSATLHLPGSQLSFSLQFLVRGGSSQKLRWEATRTETATLPTAPPRRTWAIEAVLADGSHTRLQNPTILVVP